MITIKTFDVAFAASSHFLLNLLAPGLRCLDMDRATPPAHTQTAPTSFALQDVTTLSNINCLKSQGECSTMQLEASASERSSFVVELYILKSYDDELPGHAATDRICTLDLLPFGN